MRSLGIQGAIRGKAVRTTLGDRSTSFPAERVKRQFQAPRPNALSVSDFACVSTWQGFVYKAFVIDAFARRIVGWRVFSTSSAGFVLDALEWVAWFNHRRLLEPIGNVPPAEAKARFCARQQESALAV
jgi:transposase InsO family protein